MAIEHNMTIFLRWMQTFHILPKISVFIRLVEDGADLAIGSRYCNGISVVNWPIGRVIMSYYAST